MTQRAFRRKPGVTTASPVRQPPIARQAASSSGPAARCTAPSTPPPPRSPLLAAVTTASTSSVVMSAWIARSGMAASVSERATVLARVAAADQHAALPVYQDRLAAAVRPLHQRDLVAEAG